MKKHLKLYSILVIIIVLLFSVLSVLMTGYRFSDEVVGLIEDFFYQHPSSIPGNIKIIAIDEEAINALGPYSDWDRTYFADLINILNESENVRPAVIGVDVIFSGTGNPDSDRALAEAAANYGNIVFASKLEISSRIDTDENGNYYFENYIRSEAKAYDELSEAAYSGFTTPMFDSDGYIRRSYGTLVSDGREYNNFSVMTAQRYGVFFGNEGYEFLYSGYPGDFEAISIAKVLSGAVPASYFDDCIVLVGAYADGLMDAYSVPIDHSKNMYGVEIQANQIAAIINGRILKQIPLPLREILTFVIVFAAGILLFRCRVQTGIAVTVGTAVLYPLLCSLLTNLTYYKLDIVYIPATLILMLIAALIVRYIESQKKRNEEMQKMLFSMADSMAEAIEGRTPYNANHTKNVAKRCVEMIDYINALHKEKKTTLCFSKNDRKQLFLAAMLHDIGKLDIPTSVMDKPTRLGNEIIVLRNRLEIIKLHFQIDSAKNRTDAKAAEKECADIDSFLSQLDSFDCGRPLKENELLFIDDFGSRIYRDENGTEIPYLTQTELDNLHIKAGTLSDSEREIMKNHVVFTDKILSHVDFGKEFDKVQRLAADHHELMNGRGYPHGKTSEQLDAMTRILTIMDIYDSLIAEDRPYKKPKPIKIAFAILDEEAEAGKIDKELLGIAKQMYLKD